MDTEYGSGVYLEVSGAGSGARIGAHSILSFVEIEDDTVSSNVVLHALKQRDGKFVARIYGVGDNPKTGSDGTFLGSTLEEFMGRNQLSESELWDTEEHTLWMARPYPVCGNIREAVKAALNVYAMSCGQEDTKAWKASTRASLKSGFFNTSPDALIAWEKRMGELVKMDMLAKLISAGRPVSEA